MRELPDDERRALRRAKAAGARIAQTSRAAWTGAAMDVIETARAYDFLRTTDASRENVESQYCFLARCASRMVACEALLPPIEPGALECEFSLHARGILALAREFVVRIHNRDNRGMAETSAKMRWLAARFNEERKGTYCEPGGFIDYEADSDWGD